MRFALYLLGAAVIATCSIFFYRQVLQQEAQEQLTKETQSTLSTLLTNPAKPVSLSLDCQYLRIDERFGDYYTWHIELTGITTALSGNEVLLENSASSLGSGIKKSWFPPRAEGEDFGGFGNSVMVDAERYQARFSSPDNAASFGKALRAFTQACRAY